MLFTVVLEGFVDLSFLEIEADDCLEWAETRERERYRPDLCSRNLSVLTLDREREIAWTLRRYELMIVNCNFFFVFEFDYCLKLTT